MMLYQLRFQWVGDRCPSRHLFETGCHVLLRDINAMSSMSVLPVLLSICVCSSLLTSRIDVNKVKFVLDSFEHRTRSVFAGASKGF